MSEIEEFITARIAEDEAIATAASQKKAGGEIARWRVEARTNSQHTVWNGIGQAVVPTSHDHQGPHIARHDPAAVLRQCEAYRAILVEHGTVGVPDGDEFSDYCNNCETWGPCATVRALAWVWSDHPDYQAEWGE